MVVYHIRENFQVFESMRIAFPALMAQELDHPNDVCMCAEYACQLCVSAKQLAGPPCIN